MVHAKTFTPKPNPVTEVFGNNELVIIPEPEIKDQVPTPTIALFAAINVFGLEIQSVWFGPALAVVGAGLTMIVTFETDAAQGLLEMVHANTFVPVPNPVID